MFGISVPIFAFSHCRDVVVEVSKAGGLGVLGMARMPPEKVKEELNWIDSKLQGKYPYGIDILNPATYEDAAKDKADPDAVLPAAQRDYVRKMLDEHGVPRLPPEDEEEARKDMLKRFTFTPDEGAKMVDIALDHPIKLLVNALGSPSKELVEKCHAKGVKVAAMAGHPKHALKHKAVGCDFVIAVGTEAGGHTGTVTSMVLWPRIVDAVYPMPVLGAGGVGRGRQLAAALALGCEGVWCGSVWLQTRESEVPPEIKAKMFAAGPDDAILTKTVTGKPCRTLRNKFSDIWDSDEQAPPTLPAPNQAYLWWAEGRTRVERVRAHDFLTYPVGQIVNDMKEETTTKEVIRRMIEEALESQERMSKVFG